MKKLFNLKTLSLALVLILVTCMFAACGSKDVLAGTWIDSENADYGKVSWTFDGSGKCSYETDYFSNEGTYTITDNTVTIKLELWDNEVAYTFDITDNVLHMVDNAGLAPEYTLTKQ